LGHPVMYDNILALTCSSDGVDLMYIIDGVDLMYIITDIYRYFSVQPGHIDSFA